MLKNLVTNNSQDSQYNKSFIQDTIKDLCNFISSKKKFNLEGLSLDIEDDYENDSNNIYRKTGMYAPSENKIILFVRGRHIKDVLRTLAHELIHVYQNFNKKIKADDISSENYFLEDNYLRNLDSEAYTYGNMLFREWEDNKKMSNSNETKDGAEQVKEIYKTDQENYDIKIQRDEKLFEELTRKYIESKKKRQSK